MTNNYHFISVDLGKQGSSNRKDFNELLTQYQEMQKTYRKIEKILDKNKKPYNAEAYVNSLEPLETKLEAMRQILKRIVVNEFEHSWL